MKIKTTLFAVPVLGFLIGALMLPVGAQTFYSRTITSYDAPDVVENRIEEPMPMSFDRPVTIERPIVIERALPPALPVEEEPLLIERRPHDAFHMGLFPLGDFDVF